MDPYRSKKWRTYRAACIRAADGLCLRCASREPDVVLQIHHPSYEKGKQPWEYPVAHCKVLCRGCHAEEHGIIMPKDGWMILHADLERNMPSSPIECGNPTCQRQVTWHVTIYHPEWGELVVQSAQRICHLGQSGRSLNPTIGEQKHSSRHRDGNRRRKVAVSKNTDIRRSCFAQATGSKSKSVK